MGAGPATLELVMPNRIEALGEGAERAEAFLEAWSVSAGDRAQVMVMLDEVASNIVKNAWPQGGEHEFRIELRIVDGVAGLSFEMVAVDDGVAFDPTLAGPPALDLDLEDREIGGLGLFMVGEMSDRVEYSREGECNRLVVAKGLQRG